MSSTKQFTAFAGCRQLASGPLETVLPLVRQWLDAGNPDMPLVFDDATGTQVDFDLRGSPAEILARLPEHPYLTATASEPARPAGPGRPRLGVVSREVSLLLRHWSWLERQPQGISAGLRRLVEDEIRRDPEGERARQARDAVGKIMWALAGSLPDFEEASRALYAGQVERFATLIQPWPESLRHYLLRLLRS